LIPYRRQAADFIHAYRRDYIESYVEALDFGGLFVFLGVKTPFSPLRLFSGFNPTRKRGAPHRGTPFSFPFRMFLTKRRICDMLFLKTGALATEAAFFICPCFLKFFRKTTESACREEDQ
jgi:hypothetical protein